ncbi:class I SAM-dependent methyltransferase [Streptacidiphilus monticola]
MAGRGGYLVDLVDPVPLHVKQAGRLADVNVRLGDARALEFENESFDVALLLGPLYHLADADGRALALSEAYRVLRPDGLLVAATINRFAGLHDTLNQGRYFDPCGGRRSRLRPRTAACARRAGTRSSPPRTSTSHRRSRVKRALQVSLCSGSTDWKGQRG